MKISTLFKYFFLLFLITGLTANAQTKPEVLTNKNVIDLYKAGLSNNLIISKIENSNAKFDVSTTGLIALKKESVPEDIIQAMVDKGSPDASVKTPSVTSKSIEQQTTVIKNDVPEPEIINTVYLYDKSQKLTALEKSNATMHSHTKALGYGGAETVFEIEGEKSPVRIDPKNAQTFIINTGGGAADAFVLYKVDIKKGKRQVVAASFSTMGSMKGSKGIISVDVKLLKTNVFQLLPSTTLDKGEYFFANKSAGSALSSTNIDVYAFGIE